MATVMESTTAGEKIETMSSSLELYLRDQSTHVMGSIVGVMLLLTISLCLKTRVIDKRHGGGDKFQDDLDQVNINLYPGEKKDTGETDIILNDHEDYALVETSNENCYVDLPAEEYDLLRSQRQHKTCFSGPCVEANYGLVQNGGSMYDIVGQALTDVGQPDNEYEMVKNMQKSTY
ncbi:uncharacterized protein LOC111103684 isoform X3 [Crassostrea virginica]